MTAVIEHWFGGNVGKETHKARITKTTFGLLQPSTPQDLLGILIGLV
jgi:hypothetical protein